MTIEEIINYLTALWESDGITVNEAMALGIAIKSIKAWDKIDKDLKTMMEGDKRTFNNQITDDSKYYDGIYDAIKVIQRYFEEVN